MSDFLISMLLVLGVTAIANGAVFRYDENDKVGRRIAAGLIILGAALLAAYDGFAR